jgi:hypothetical protein
MLIGKLEVPKRGSEIPVVCIEPVQLPSEGVLIARGVSRTIVPIQKSKQPCVQTPGAARRASDVSQDNDVVKAAVHVMVVNISNEDVDLPKGTVLGMAEEVSETLVATVNDGPVSEPRRGTPR